MIASNFVRLHPTLDDVERVRGEPERLSCKTSVECDLPRRDVGAGLVAGFHLHEIFECQEPDPVGLNLSKDGDHFAAVEALRYATGFEKLADTVCRAIIEAGGAMGLGLEADTDVFYRAGDYT